MKDLGTRYQIVGTQILGNRKNGKVWIIQRVTSLPLIGKFIEPCKSVFSCIYFCRLVYFTNFILVAFQPLDLKVASQLVASLLILLSHPLDTSNVDKHFRIS